MWSRKFYHSFAQLSTEVIRGNCKAKGKYATFEAVEPYECSSSQTRRATNCATPGYSVIHPAGRILPNQAPYQLGHTRKYLALVCFVSKHYELYMMKMENAIKKTEKPRKSKTKMRCCRVSYCLLQWDVVKSTIYVRRRWKPWNGMIFTTKTGV